jgi:hypothetical protein
MTTSLKILGRNQTEKALYEVAAEMAVLKNVADDGNRKVMIEGLRVLAREYAQLEFKTIQAVRTIKSYGKAWQEAAEDFLEDGDVNELLHELGDMKETKDALKDANEKHIGIRYYVLIFTKYFITKSNVSRQIKGWLE